MRSKTNRKPASAPARSPSGAARRQQIVKIAANLFGEKGYDGTSLRDIAEASGITKAALYYHFPDKERLYEDVVVTRLSALIEAVREAVATSDDPVEKIRLFMIAGAQRAERDRSGWIASSNIFWSLVTTTRHGKAIVDLRDEFEHLLRDLIVEAIKQKRFRLVDPAILGRLLLSGLNQIPRWHKPSGRLSAQQVMEQYLSIVFNGILVP
jgi:AcrR family transcriptional regulator